MTTVTLGKTGIVSPKNAFGALPIQRVSFEEAGRLLLAAYDGGMTYFDTARAYSDSEEKMGRALKDVRKNIVIATKTHAKDADGFWKDLHESLRMLQTDHIDVYQFHNPAVCPKPGDGSGAYEAMLEAKKQGKILHIGITNHRLAVAEEAVKSGLYETLQFPFCYLAQDRDIALTEMCRRENVGFIAMKGLSGGLLNHADAAYAWIAQYDNVLPIWGVQRETELREFLSFMKEPPAMTEAMRARIEADRKELIGEFCRGCGYCMPCSAGIKIMECARMSQMIRRAPSRNSLTPEAQEMMMQIEKCKGCGQCIRKCPYHLNTPELLKKNLEDYKNILAGKTKV